MHISNLTIRAQRVIFILVMIMSPLGQMSIDFYSTSLPIMAVKLGVSSVALDCVTVSFLIAYGFGQIVHGTLCDIIGRKRLLMIMLPFYIVTTLIVPFCPSVFLIALMRLVQGFAIAAVSVTVKSIATDVFQGKLLIKAVSVITIIWGLSPIVAPLIGSVIQTYWGWHWCFYTLGGATLILYGYVVFLLPETLKHHNSFHPRSILHKYKKIGMSKMFWIYMAQINLAIVGLLSFILQTPELIQNVYHLTSIQNGFLCLFISLMYLLGTQLSGRLIAPKLLFILPLIIFVLSILLCVSSIVLSDNKIEFILCSSIIMFVCGGLFPVSLSKSLLIFPSDTGTVSGCVGFITLTSTGVFFSFISLLNISVSQKFPIIMLACSLLTLTLTSFFFNNHLKSIENE